jgi:prepilin-type N-terminal cleavage/methylation domain-containing protein
MTNRTQYSRSNGGFTIMEMLIAVGILGIVATVSVGVYVGYLRTAETVDPLETISVLKQQVAILNGADQGLIACDDSMVNPGGLDNPYMTLSIVPAELDAVDLTKGYGVAVAVHASVDIHGSVGVQVARSLHDELVGADAIVSDAVLKDSVVAFVVLVSNPGQSICVPPMQPPAKQLVSLPTVIPLQPVLSPALTQAADSATQRAVADLQGSVQTLSSTIAQATTPEELVKAQQDLIAKAQALPDDQLTGSVVNPEKKQFVVDCADVGIDLSMQPGERCEDHLTTDCSVTFGPQHYGECIVAKICRKSTGVCAGIPQELEALLQQSAQRIKAMQDANATP